MRLCLVGFAAMVLFYALHSELSIFGMVESAYKITLAGAFVPLLFGAFWKRATSQGALAAIILGIGSWVLVEVLVGEASLVPAQLLGLLVSAIAMVIGSLLPQKLGGSPAAPHGYLHEHASRRHAE
jgi:solute:Na+ symporter, SSS family